MPPQLVASIIQNTSEEQMADGSFRNATETEFQNFCAGEMRMVA